MTGFEVERPTSLDGEQTLATVFTPNAIARSATSFVATVFLNLNPEG